MVIGTSAGGFNALDRLVRQFNLNDNAAYCILMHHPDSQARSFLIKQLQPLTDLPCHVAEDELPIQKGHIYIAQPGSHLLVKNGKLVLGYGPAENSYRPSIDILFRSAAAAYNTHTIGVILTGMLEDGTAGMRTIKGYGGTLVIQDPLDAEFPSMPRTVESNMEVDYSVPLQQIGAVITRIIATGAAAPGVVLPEAQMEAGWSERMATHPSGAGEVPAEDHGCGEEAALRSRLDASEPGIWIAVRMMEERQHLLVSKAVESTGRRLFTLAAGYTRKAENLNTYIQQLKALLTEMENRPEDPEGRG